MLTSSHQLKPVDSVGRNLGSPLAFTHRRTFLGDRVGDLGFLQRSLLLLIALDIPFHVDKVYRYDEYLATLNAVGGLQLSLTTFCTLALYALWFCEAALNRFVVNSLRPKVNRFLVVYLAAAVVSGVYASRRDLALNELVILVQTFLIYLYVVKRVRSRNDILFLMTALVFSLLLHGVVLVGVFGLGRSVQLGPWNLVVEGNRAAGNLGSPNTAGSFLELLLAPCFAMLLVSRSQWRILLSQAAFVAGIIGLVLTFSRGAWLASVFSLLLFFAITWRSGWLPRKIAFSFAVCMLLSGLVFGGTVMERLSSEEAATAEGRFALWRLAQRMITESPILGVGANNYAAVMDQYISHPDFTGAWLRTVHNKYLLVWAENGLLGLIGFLGFLVTAVIAGWRVWKIQDRLLSPLALSLAVGILGQMVHMNLDIFHRRPQVQLLWIVCALLASIQAVAFHPVALETMVGSRDPSAGNVAGRSGGSA